MRFSTALKFQGSIVLVGLVLGAIFGLWSRTTWLLEDAGLLSAHWWGQGPGFATAVGFVLSLVMFAVVVTLTQFPFRWLQRIEEKLDDQLLPLLKNRSLFDLGLLCLLAGLGEELLFRWAIQGGVELWLSGYVSTWMAWGIAMLASAVLFGLAHFITPAYVIMAAIIGIVMSVTVVVGGGLWAAILAHALYDFWAMLWLTRR